MRTTDQSWFADKKWPHDKVSPDFALDYIRHIMGTVDHDIEDLPIQNSEGMEVGYSDHSDGQDGRCLKCLIEHMLTRAGK